MDLLISTACSGLKYFELIEVLRESLKKKVDLIDAHEIHKNPKLLQEILKDGFRIYKKG